MNILSCLRTMLRVYAVEEPRDFRVAEQFGLDDGLASAARPPRFERDEVRASSAVGGAR